MQKLIEECITNFAISKNIPISKLIWKNLRLSVKNTWDDWYNSNKSQEWILNYRFTDNLCYTYEDNWFSLKTEKRVTEAKLYCEEENVDILIKLWLSRKKM